MNKLRELWNGLMAKLRRGDSEQTTKK